MNIWQIHLTALELKSKHVLDLRSICEQAINCLTKGLAI